MQTKCSQWKDWNITTRPWSHVIFWSPGVNELRSAKPSSAPNDLTPPWRLNAMPPREGWMHSFLLFSATYIGLQARFGRQRKNALLADVLIEFWASHSHEDTFYYPRLVVFHPLTWISWSSTETASDSSLLFWCQASQLLDDCWQQRIILGRKLFTILLCHKQLLFCLGTEHVFFSIAFWWS